MEELGFYLDIKLAYYSYPSITFVIVSSLESFS